MEDKQRIEIEKIADIYCIEKSNIGESHDFISYVDGYTQCQEDMVDKKYTEEDIIKAFQKGWESREPQYDGGWKTTLTAQDYINSLNKQD